MLGRLVKHFDWHPCGLGSISTETLRSAGGKKKKDARKFGVSQKAPVGGPAHLWSSFFCLTAANDDSDLQIMRVLENSYTHRE